MTTNDVVSAFHPFSFAHPKKDLLPPTSGSQPPVSEDPAFGELSAHFGLSSRLFGAHFVRIVVSLCGILSCFLVYRPFTPF
jgi:hypothetical protein